MRFSQLCLTLLALVIVRVRRGFPLARPCLIFFASFGDPRAAHALPDHALAGPPAPETFRLTGVLILSTPKPAGLTKMIDGVNPFYIRELQEDELAELLRPHFEHVQLLYQHEVSASTIEAIASQKAYGGEWRRIRESSRIEGSQ
jgi:hypothetical protein